MATRQNNKPYVVVMRKKGDNKVEFILDDKGIFPRLFRFPEEAVMHMVSELGMKISDIRECKFVKVVSKFDVEDIKNNKVMDSLEAFDIYNEHDELIVINNMNFKIIRRRNNE